MHNKEENQQVPIQKTTIPEEGRRRRAEKVQKAG